MLLAEYSLGSERSSAKAMLKSAMENFTLPENFNYEELRQLANGFFQAEGCVSARLKPLHISPLVVLTQDLSKEPSFFVTLWHSTCYGRGDTKGIVVAWKVKFNSKLGLKDKQFAFSKHGGRDSALAKAVEYRDT